MLDGSQPHTFDSGDETLKQYLLSDSDLPSGFTPEGTFTASVPASDSFSGGDAAVSIASKGGPNGTDFNGMMLGSLVVRTNDASQLEQAFSEAGAFSGDDLQNLLGSNSAPFITNVQTLDTSGLSDHAIGISVTMDFSQLISAFAGAFGASPDASDPSLTSMVMTMHIYMTVHGDLAGGVMSVAFGSASDDVNELALARIVDQKLQAAN